MTAFVIEKQRGKFIKLNKLKRNFASLGRFDSNFPFTCCRLRFSIELDPKISTSQYTNLSSILWWTTKKGKRMISYRFYRKELVQLNWVSNQRSNLLRSTCCLHFVYKSNFIKTQSSFFLKFKKS